MSAQTTRTITLQTPIEAHGEKLTQLVLRKPTTAELCLHGQPYTAVKTGGGGIKADYAVCAALIAAICAIPPSSVEQLDMADFDEAAMTLVGFTGRAPRAASPSGSPPKS